MVPLSAAKRCLLAAITLGLMHNVAWAEDTQYKYNPRGELLLSSTLNGRQNTYAYDPAGNRTRVVSRNITPPTTQDKLYAGQGLTPGRALVSPDGRHSLLLQEDGNLVLYGPAGPRWATGTYHKLTAIAFFQHDANFVLYDAADQGLWGSGTNNAADSVLALQNDGNVVIYTSTGQPLWATNTSCPC